MKKLIALLLTLITSISYSAEVVQVVWPFALGNNQANIIRTMIDNANKNQNKYQFIFVNKQGASGTIAVNSVLASSKISVLANSSSFYTTPLLSKEAYNVDQFNILSRMCIDRPLAIFSKNTKKLSSNELSIGVIPSSIIGLVPLAINQRTPEFRYLGVPFKTAPDGTLAMLSGVVDASVDWFGASTSIVSPTNGVNIIGITGTRSINGNPLLPGTENLVGDVFLFLPKNVDSTTYKELHHVFQESLNEHTDMFCKNDFGKPVKTDISTVDKIHSENKARWQKLTLGMSPQ